MPLGVAIASPPPSKLPLSHSFNHPLRNHLQQDLLPEAGPLTPAEGSKRTAVG